MKFIIFIFIVLIFTKIAFSEPIREQYGVFGNYGLNFHSVDFRALPGVPNCCPNFKEGFGSGYSFGISYDIPIYDNIYLSNKIKLINNYSILSQKEYFPIILNLEEKTGVIEHIIESNFYSIGYNPYVNYKFFDFLNFGVGFEIGYQFSANYNQKEQLIEPTNIGYFKENQSRERNLNTGKINNLNNLTYSISSEISTDLKLNEKRTLLLTPFLSFNYGISNLVKDLTWKSNILSLGLIIKYSPIIKNKVYNNIYKIDTVKYINQELPEDLFVQGQIDTKTNEQENDNTIFIDKIISRTDTILKSLKPKKDENKIELAKKEKIENFKIYDDKISKNEVSSILIKAKRITEYQPVLNYIFFDYNSSEINKKYFQDEVEMLNISSKIYFYRNIFDLIAKNHSNTSSNIILIGTVDPTTEKDNCNLALNRARNVKDYLIKNYGISDSRIKIVQKTKNCYPEIPTKSLKEEGYSENRRVEVIFENQEQFSLSLSREFLNPISLYPKEIFINIDSNYTNNLEKWNLKLYNGEKEIVNFSNPDIEKIKYNFNNNDINNLNQENSIKASLSLLYLNGEEVNSSKELKIIKEVIDDEVLRLTLKPFKVSQSNLDDLMKKDIANFISKLDDSYLIFITGYTDPLGAKLENKNLSKTRAEAVRDFILKINSSLRIVSTKGLGDTEKLPGIESYDTPEERFMSRTVFIQAIKVRGN